MSDADYLTDLFVAGNPPPAMVLHIAICPENYELIYKAMDLKSAYTIVKEYTEKMPESDSAVKTQFMQIAKAERIQGEKAVRKGDIEKADFYIQRLCKLAVQVNIR